MGTTKARGWFSCFFLNIKFLIEFIQDFGDSGAFPEIHVPQFPLGMGKQKKTSNALAVQLDSAGEVRFDAIAKQGSNKNKVKIKLLFKTINF